MSCDCGESTNSTKKKEVRLEVKYVVGITYTTGESEQQTITAEIHKKGDVPYLRLKSKDRALPCVDLWYDHTQGYDRDIACGVRKFKIISKEISPINDYNGY